MTEKDPFVRFGKVFDEAVAAGMANPNAMSLGSVSADGQPSARTVLLKDFDPRGFVFYTNFESRKGREILANPRVSLNFYWRELGKQVIILGQASRVDDAEADEYFATRPLGSQLGAWASQQSRPLESTAHLLKEVAKVEARFLGRKVERPPHWSGFRVAPHWIEFWVEGRFRLHERTVYEPDGDTWKHYRLNP